jgi:alpha-mannosidase
VLVASFGAYQPRTFAVRLAAPAAKVAGVRSTPVVLHYDLAAASNDGARSARGFDDKGNALPAEMLPAQIAFNDVRFQLEPARSGVPNALVAKGQTIDLPAGSYNKVYVLAASAGGDQKAAFDVTGKKVELNIQDWGGFIGQWDDRQWSSTDTSHDDYGEMIGLKPSYIKRADLAWYSDHYHNASGENVAYSYSYLFAYEADLPPGKRSLKLPQNDKIRILAVSVADENPGVRPVQPLYDVLPSPNAGPADFTLSASSKQVTISQGRSATTRIIVMPRGSLSGNVSLTVSGLPKGVTASFNPASTTGYSTMTLAADRSAIPTSATVTITGKSGAMSHTADATVDVTRVMTGTVAVDLAPTYNVTGIYNDGSKFTPAASLDSDGFAFSAQLLGSEQVGDGVVFKVGPANAPDAVTSKTVALPDGKFASLKMLAVGVNGDQELQTFTVTYADGTSTSFTQSLSDWAVPRNFTGESAAVAMPYRLTADGSKDARTFYGNAYSFNLNSSKEVRSVSLPSNRDVLVFAMTLVPGT